MAHLAGGLAIVLGISTLIGVVLLAIYGVGTFVAFVLDWIDAARERSVAKRLERLEKREADAAKKIATLQAFRHGGDS